VTTVYVVPCGLSVLDKLGGKLSGGTPATTFMKAIEHGRWLDGVELDDPEQVGTAWLDTAAGKAGKAGLSEVSAKRLSAETHSLATHVTSRPPGNDQHVLLLASDTKLGLSAAFCVGQYLSGAPAGQITYASSPRVPDQAFKLRPAEALVTVIRIRGLGPAQTNLDLAASGIGKTLRAAGDTGDAVEVHLTGGLKATLLHTLAMSEILHSVAPDRVTAWNVFENIEDSSSDQPKPPAQIGLRAFPREYLANMRSELARARTDSVGGSRTFQGVAWTETADGKRHLNAFGHGYLAVLGEPSSALGDDSS
jgi:hypothetical protein